jgi:hypothetical protein
MEHKKLSIRRRRITGRGPPYSEPAADGDAAADDVVDDTEAHCPRCPLMGEFLLCASIDACPQETVNAIYSDFPKLIIYGNS